jgi:hypothetical protein
MFDMIDSILVQNLEIAHQLQKTAGRDIIVSPELIVESFGKLADCLVHADEDVDYF